VVSVGIAYLVTLLGLTASLGAFVAGLVMNSGTHRERALQYVIPFQVVFAAVFFASIGTLLDLGFVPDHLGDVVFFALAVITVKAVVVAVAARAFRQTAAVTAAAALLLGQIGEFSFVLNTVGSDAGLALAGQGADESQIFIAVVVLLIALTPVLRTAGQHLQRRVGTAAGSAVVRPIKQADAARTLRRGARRQARDPRRIRRPRTKLSAPSRSTNQSATRKETG
jgi:monovalent cation:H+ antiporter-2, CPA2 family